MPTVHIPLNEEPDPVKIKNATDFLAIIGLEYTLASNVLTIKLPDNYSVSNCFQLGMTLGRRLGPNF